MRLPELVEFVGQLLSIVLRVRRGESLHANGV